jgi:alpha-mannosidase
MNWLWGWQETVAVTIDTFDTVLKLMDEFPTFCFTQSQASVYEIVREHHPEQFERIKARVKEGRWEVAASHWVEGDQNLASGESLCRHLLYTRRFMQQHLGLKPEDVTVDWTPDTFGHARTIPAIDSRGGVKHMYMCRPGGDRPPVFWWKAPDGSKVLVNKETLWYNSELRPASTHKLIEFHAKTGLRDWLQVYGVGDHGGGPTRRDLRCAVDMDGWPIFPRFTFATTKSFFAKLETAASAKDSRIPVIEEELNYEFAGCYTSQSSIKKANRFGENLMSEADAAAALAFSAIGREYPQQKLEKAWRDVLFSHFHDILPGSGIRQTREYNSAMFQNIQAVAGQVKTQSLRALAKAIDTSAGGAFQVPAVQRLPEHESVAFGAGVGKAAGEISQASVVMDGPRAAVVFNPTAWPRDEVVRVTVWDMDTGTSWKPMNQRSYVAKAADGTVVPAQRVHDGHYWGHNFVELAIPARVGARGWTTYEIAEAAAPQGASKVWGRKEAESGVNSPHGALEIENELVKIAFDRATGGIVSYVLKATGQDVADPKNPLGVLEFVRERPVGMSAWILGDVQERRLPLEVQSVDLIQAGPHTAIVKVVAKVTADSTFTVHYDLTAGSPNLAIAVDGTWLERGRNDTFIPRLAIRFPFAIQGAKARYEVPYGSLARTEPAGREVPALRWAEVAGQVGGKSGGCAVLNDCKYGHSLDGSTLRINIVRSSYEPDPLPEIGQQQARFALAPFTGEASAADLIRLGAAFNHPLQTVVAPIHGGELPSAVSAASCAPANVIVTQLKRAEDSNDLVFRLLETAGKATTAAITLDAKTFGRVASATEADVLERPAAGSTAKATGTGFEVALGAHGIATVKVAVKR